jgi:hypothetical protein
MFSKKKDLIEQIVNCGYNIFRAHVNVSNFGIERKKNTNIQDVESDDKDD